MGLPGRVVLDRYRIVRPIVRGAVATVYLSFDESGKPFAIKVFPEGYSARADREWRVGSSLDHPNVNHIIERFDIDDCPAVLMEFASGKRLSDMQFPAKDGFIAVFMQLLAALAHMHQRGFVHRDVKPENLMVANVGSVKLIDFDLSGPRSEHSNNLRLGTIAYLAPEQAMGQPPTPASDVYAAGIILYWGLTGELPFVGDPRSVIQSHLNDPLPSSSIEEDRYLQRLLEKMVAKDPQFRYANASEALSEFAALS